MDGLDTYPNAVDKQVNEAFRSAKTNFYYYLAVAANNKAGFCQLDRLLRKENMHHQLNSVVIFTFYIKAFLKHRRSKEKH